MCATVQVHGYTVTEGGKMVCSLDGSMSCDVTADVTLSAGSVTAVKYRGDIALAVKSGLSGVCVERGAAAPAAPTAMKDAGRTAATVRDLEASIDGRFGLVIRQSRTAQRPAFADCRDVSAACHGARADWELPAKAVRTPPAPSRGRPRATPLPQNRARLKILGVPPHRFALKGKSRGGCANKSSPQWVGVWS